MLCFIQQLLSIVLAMDIEQRRPDLPQLSSGTGTAVDTAYGFSIGLDIPLQQEHSFLIGRNSLPLQHFQRRIHI